MIGMKINTAIYISIGCDLFVFVLDFQVNLQCDQSKFQ